MMLLHGTSTLLRSPDVLVQRCFWRTQYLIYPPMYMFSKYIVILISYSEGGLAHSCHLRSEGTSSTRYLKHFEISSDTLLCSDNGWFILTLSLQKRNLWCRAIDTEFTIKVGLFMNYKIPILCTIHSLTFESILECLQKTWECIPNCNFFNPL